jgi:5-methylcytosine-specific restriction endonuclease McrA
MKVDVSNVCKNKLPEYLIDLYMSGTNDIIKIRSTDTFYSTKEWKALKKQIHTKYGYTCMKCYYIDKSNVVDHIYPRSKFPLLELEPDNMQVLCTPCNLRKSNKHFNDYRESFFNKNI